MSQPRFTFCIPNLNKIKYLPACIESVLAQDCKDWRCIIVDGYSTDGSWEYLQQFATDPRFLIRRGIRQGMYADWNECLKHVETEYFYFLPSDDTCFPALVATTTKLLDEHLDISVCHFPFSTINEFGETIKSADEMVRSKFERYAGVNQYAHRRSGLCEFMMQCIYGAMYTSMTSLVFRRNIIEKLNGFKSIYGHAGDFDWTMRLALITDFVYIPKQLATWRACENQATNEASPLEYLETVLTITSDNLEAFMKAEKHNHISILIRREHLLYTFLNNHAYFLLKESFQVGNLYRRYKLFHAFLSNYPSYIPKKILNRISFDFLFPRWNQASLANFYIEKCSLLWPPVQIEDHIA